MKDRNVLNIEELTQAVGGVSFNVNGSSMIISPEPNEFATVALQKKRES